MKTKLEIEPHFISDRDSEKVGFLFKVGVMEMKKLFILILAVSIVGISPNVSYSAQYWAKTYGGSDYDNYDYAKYIQQTIDGGYIILGYTKPSQFAPYSNIWVFKLQGNGDFEWQKTYEGDKGGGADSIQQTLDGGYIIAGGTSSFGAINHDGWILKLDSIGNISWQKTYGSINYECLKSIQQTYDGGYIVAGSYTSASGTGDDFWVLKLNSTGNVTWQKAYGGSGSEYAHSIQQTKDNGYIVTGYTSSFGAGNTDFWILKLDESGDISWQKIYGGSDSDHPHSICQTSDGGYIVAGYTHSFGASIGDFPDLWVLKLDSNGNISWQKTYGGSHSEYADSIKQTIDGGYIVAGRTYFFGAGNADFWVLKLDENGDVVWEKTYGGSDPEHAYSIQQTSDGGYIVAGQTYSFGAGHYDGLVLKLDENGDIPDCDIIGVSNATVENTYVSGQNSSAIIESTSAIITDTDIIPQDSSADINTICLWIDSDDDGIPDDEDICPYDPENDVDSDNICGDVDNCPYHPNSPDLGTCIYGENIGAPCTIPGYDPMECGVEGFCSMNQEDTDSDEVGNAFDNCPSDSNQDQLDTDSDDIGDVCDNCPSDYNPDQLDTDKDGIGDVCDIEPTTSSTTTSYKPPPPNTTTTSIETTSSTSSISSTSTTIISTTSSPSSTTTTIKICPIEKVYGENSEEVELLRYFRDNVLNQTPEGRELIRLYYQWSPVIVEMMKNDVEFKEDMKEMIDGVLVLIRGEVE